MPKILMTIGLILIILALLWPLIQKMGLGNLPGDIVIKRENFKIYFPVATCIIISVIVSIIIWFFRK